MTALNNGVGLVGNDFTTEAKLALAALDKHGQDQIPLMLRLGAALSKAKATLKHGLYKKWCAEDFGRSPSWCSSYRRLHEDRACLEEAFQWAQKYDHRYANCRSVERLLTIVSDWKKRNSRSDAAVAASPRPKPADVIADLQKR